MAVRALPLEIGIIPTLVVERVNAEMVRNVANVSIADNAPLNSPAGDVAKARARLFVTSPALLAFVERIAQRDPVFAKGSEKQVIADARALVEAAAEHS